MSSCSRVSRIAALAVIALAGCGFNSSPANGLTFQPPPGWQSSPGIMGFMQFWRPPGHDSEVLMLFKSPRPLKPSEVFSDARMQDTLKNATIERRSTISICGNQPAEYVAARGSSSRGEDSNVQVVMTNVAGSTYIAMYVRPIASPANPSAVAALKELCAKP